LCIVNGLSVDESSLISPTTISAGATTIRTIYSSTAVSVNSPFRILGFIDITEATAGTWATAPTLIQGQGGSLSPASLGIGQTWQAVARGNGTAYYNTTGRTITVNVGKAASGTSTAFDAYVDTGGGYVQVAHTVSDSTNGVSTSCCSFPVPPGAAYYWTSPSGAYFISELR
jgi:hypothetical protein